MAIESTLVRLFAQNLRTLRTDRGVTQVEMADRLGVTHSAYCQVESGRNAPTLTTVEKIATALGVNAEDLLSGKKLARSA